MAITSLVSKRLETGLKVCSKCKLEQGLVSGFNRNGVSGDGRTAWCKACLHLYARARRASGLAPVASPEALARRKVSPAFGEAQRRHHKRRWADPDKRHKAEVRIFNNDDTIFAYAVCVVGTSTGP